MQTFNAEAARAIAEAVRDVESRSAAEIVVDIRARAGSYAHADARFAAALALVSLAVVVYMPWVVPPLTVLLDPVAFYLLGVVTARRSPVIRRLFTSRRERDAAVRTHAAAAFHDRGIAGTSAETGVLLFVSLLERRIEVLADRGLLRRVNANEWNAALAELHRDEGITPDTVLAAIRTFGVILGRDVPADEANADELTSTPEIQLA